MNNKNIQNYIMKTKIIPFDIELAKKIQSGEVEGRIITKNGGEARILAFDSKSYFVDSEIECYTTKDKGINKPLVVEYLDVNGDSPCYQVVNLLSNGKLVTWGDSDCDLIIELPEEAPKHEFKVGDKVRVNLPKDVVTKYLILGNYQGKVATIINVEGSYVKVKADGLQPYSFDVDYLIPYKEKHEFKPFDNGACKKF